MEEKDTIKKKSFCKDKKNIIIAILIFIILCICSSSDTETMARLNGDISNLSNEVTSLSIEKENLSNQLKESQENEEQNVQAKIDNTVNEYKIQIEKLQIVYITNTGKKYHSSGCSYLKQSKNAIDKNSAIFQGYTACSRCNP